MPKKKDVRIYLEDISQACKKVMVYITGMGFEEFKRDERTKDAVLRNLEVMGEAVKSLPKDFKENYKEVKWKAIAGMRDKLIHEYFGVSPDIIWQTLKNDIPQLELQIKNILKKLK